MRFFRDSFAAAFHTRPTAGSHQHRGGKAPVVEEEHETTSIPVAASFQKAPPIDDRRKRAHVHTTLPATPGTSRFNPTQLCQHKLSTSCNLSSIPTCCACTDKRPRAKTYQTYIDGVGQCMRGTRWQNYCCGCKGYWSKLASKGDVLEGPIRRAPLPTLRIYFERNHVTHPWDIHNYYEENLFVGTIRNQAQIALDAPDCTRIRLFFRSKELLDDDVRARDVGFRFGSQGPRNTILCEVEEDVEGKKGREGEIMDSDSRFEILADLEKLEKEIHSLEKVYLELQEAESNSPRKTLSNPRSCLICAEDKPAHDFPARKITPDCQHEPQVCSRDLQTWIASEMEDKGWDKIACPECNEPLKHSDVQALALKVTFERYETLATRALLSSDSNFVWCLKTDCGSGQIHESGRDGPIFTCVECKTKICITHARAWHEGETCQQFDRRMNANKRDGNEAATTRLIERTTRTCPGKPGQPCGWHIEKSEGCDHMTCSRCGGEFCYECLAFYEPIRKHGNYLHRRNCKYHSDNLPRPSD